MDLSRWACLSGSTAPAVTHPEHTSSEAPTDVLQELLEGGYTDGMVVDVGLPVMHCGVRYNCRLFLLNGRLLLLRPKQNLADDGNYRRAPAGHKGLDRTHH